MANGGHETNGKFVRPEGSESGEGECRWRHGLMSAICGCSKAVKLSRRLLLYAR